VPYGYVHHERACISGANDLDLHEYGVSVARCAEICDSSQQCLAFEYGVDYSGQSGVEVGECIRSGVEAGPCIRVGECRPQSQTTQIHDEAHCEARNLDLYIKPSPMPPLVPLPARRAEPYSFLDRACVSGANIQVLPGLSVDACAEICDADSDCLAFEYGVEYPGLSGHGVGDCRPQSASTVLRPCNSHNLDLYIKPSQTSNHPAGYLYHDRACISSLDTTLAGLGSVDVPGEIRHEPVSVARCAEICDSLQECLAFEYGVDYPGRSGFSGIDVGECRPQSSNTQIRDRAHCEARKMDLYVKPDVPYGSMPPLLQ